jgi:hypothetical protein
MPLVAPIRCRYRAVADTRGTDDRQLLLWRWVDDNFRYGDHYADGIHATSVVFGGRLEQPVSKHSIVCWRHCWSATDRSHW